MTTQFEQGNQATLDVTREELYLIEGVLLEERRKLVDDSGYNNLREEYKKRCRDMIVKYDKIEAKIREALDLYQ